MVSFHLFLNASTEHRRIRLRGRYASIMSFCYFIIFEEVPSLYFTMFKPFCILSICVPAAL